MASYYDYKELREKATAQNATQSDIDALGELFVAYGADSWNGEYYDADDGFRLFPIFEKNQR